MGQAADELALHARPDDRHLGQRHDGRHHHRQSRHDRREVSRSALRGRHRERRRPRCRQARIEVAARCRHRRLRAPRLQAGRNAGRRVPPAGLHAQAARRLDDALAALRSRRQRAKARKGPRGPAPMRCIVDLEDSVAPPRKAEARGDRRGFRPRGARRGDAAAPSRAHQRARRPASPMPISTASWRRGPDGIVLPKTIGGADV